MNHQKHHCWICNHDALTKLKESDFDPNALDSNQFAITNADYGKTGELSQCNQCGFIQCTSDTDVLHYYEDLIDHQYEDTRDVRAIQETKIMQLIRKFKPNGTHLDIGAGSGIMVEAALQMGYQSEGVEPSKWLQQKAVEKGLPIHQGIFPNKLITKQYDIITLIDVVEHIDNPNELYTEVRKQLTDNGIFVVITPDKDSMLARILGNKWWHYRMAHIGYFNKKTLGILAANTRFKLIKSIRPAWYFRLEYLWERALQYIPKPLHFKLPKFIARIIVPINLRDSRLVIYSKQDL